MNWLVIGSNSARLPDESPINASPLKKEKLSFAEFQCHHHSHHYHVYSVSYLLCTFDETNTQIKNTRKALCKNLRLSDTEAQLGAHWRCLCWQGFEPVLAFTKTLRALRNVPPTPQNQPSCTSWQEHQGKFKRQPDTHREKLVLMRENGPLYRIQIPTKPGNSKHKSKGKAKQACFRRN